jgi:hypothetical protein
MCLAVWVAELGALSANRGDMKRFMVIIGAALVFAAGCLLFSSAASPTTSWQTVQKRIPGAFNAAALHALQAGVEDPDRVSLPLGLRIRQSLTPRPVVLFGAPESVQDFLLEPDSGGPRFHCLVRFTRSKVARIVIQYPKAARKNAAALEGALRRAFPNDRVSLYEDGGT